LLNCLKYIAIMLPKNMYYIVYPYKHGYIISIKDKITTREAYIFVRQNVCIINTTQNTVAAV